MGFRLFLIGVIAALGLAQAQQLATRQLVLDLEGGVSYLNGAPVTLNPAPRTQDGRTVLPLRETARVLGLTVETSSAPSGLRLGKLELYPKLKLARLDGAQVALSDVAVMQGDTLFIYTRTLEVALGLNSVYDASQRLLTLTYIPGVAARDTTRPVARFGTDKREYRLGEPVLITEYSYDPDGQPVALSFTGREEAYYTPGPKDITLVATNRAGKVSDPYTVRINVLPDVLNTPRDYALRYYAPGRTFQDPDILKYPALLPERLDEPSPMLFSDSPENVPQSGVMYADSVSGAARVLAYHVNTMLVPARMLVLATNGEATPTTVQLQRLGETSASRVVAVLGQASLMDFLRSDSKEQLVLQPGQTVMLYASSPLITGQGLNLMADLVTSGRVNLTLAMVEDGLLPLNPSSENLAALLGGLPNLEPDSVHVRGTFPNAVRNLRVRLDGAVGRLMLGDGTQDPYMRGVDALTGTTNVLRGNYGMTYRITLEGATGAAGAFSPRGGLYSGAITVNGLLMPLPDSGVLYRPDSPMLLFRESRGDLATLEFVPASGSFLPVNLIFYRLDSPSLARR